MERLKEFCKKAFSYPMLLYKTHRITAVSITVTTLLFSLYLFIDAIRDWSDRGNGMELFFCLCVSFVYFSVFSLCLESICPDRKKAVKIPIFSLLALLALFLGFIFYDPEGRPGFMLTDFLEGIRVRAGEAKIVCYIVGLVAVSILLAVYFSYSRNVRGDFNCHVINAYSNVFLTSVIYGIIQLGVIFLSVIVMLLLYDDFFEFLPAILVLINGLFYVPAVVYFATNENGPANMFIQVIVRYVSLVITIIGFAIIYIYMIKLVVTASVPSNSVYAILTSLFIVSMFISYMCTSFENKGFLQKFAYNCPLIFAPFVLMQCYTVFVRIGQYGLTPKRYFGIAFIVFEIIYIVYYTYVRKRDKEIAGRDLLIILSAIIITAVFLPGINANSLSDTISKHTLAAYLEKIGNGATVSDREYMRANAAYGFLSDRDFGDGKIEKYFSGIDEDTLKALKTNAGVAAETIRSANDDDPDLPESYGWYNTNLADLSGAGSLDISEYNSLMYVRLHSPSDADFDSPEKCDPSKLYVYDQNGWDNYALESMKLETIDLSGFYKDFAALTDELDNDIIDRDEFERRCRDICIIDINESVRLCITDANTDRRGGKPVNIELEGYLLLK